MRYRILHNQIDLVLSSTLRKRNDIVVARVSVPLESPAGTDAVAEVATAQERFRETARALG